MPSLHNIDLLEHPGLGGFPALSNLAKRHDPAATWTEDILAGRWRANDYDDLINRDKASLDIFWLKDDSLSDSDNLPAPEIIAREIVADLEAALE